MLTELVTLCIRIYARPSRCLEVDGMWKVSGFVTRLG